MVTLRRTRWGGVDGKGSLWEQMVLYRVLWTFSDNNSTLWNLWNRINVYLDFGWIIWNPRYMHKAAHTVISLPCFTSLNSEVR